MKKNPESPQIPARLTLTGPHDILAAVPYILGYHPREALIVLGLRGDPPRLHTTLRRDLATGAGASVDEAAESMAAALYTEGCTTALAAGYGPAAEVTRQIDALRTGAERAGIAVREALRVDQGRYWSYLCHEPDCCPPDGVVFDPAVSAVAATAVANGLTAWPSREHVRAHLAPVEGARRERMRASTRAAEERAARLRSGAEPGGRDIFGPRFRAEGARVVRAAVGAAVRGEPPADPDRIAWLSVLLACLRVRDEAWVLIDQEDAAAQQELWRLVLRYAEPGYRPAPGALLAVTAWARGDTALAEAALERVWEADPSYSMAALVHRALRAGLAWQGFPADRLESAWPLEDP
ncbi:DUF4192 domain-containing protein [Streptomonospora litoralis]|uniref:DUF4192 domain-containing protein n=1 Tax=Streptomonospora litoralis TaxID=2498135 RepID=A0A4P6Q427_9ACTN|nr:DUF4192 domain-containing protein [Streptomonospora litoralis]QBI55385.1 hypothetical protein EKD16_18105 [Streptomonospora litoralis]